MTNLTSISTSSATTSSQESSHQSEHQKPLDKKIVLSTAEVFDKMRDKICRLDGPNGSVSGFFVHENGSLATCFHGLEVQKRRIDEGNATETIAMTDNLVCTFKGRMFQMGFNDGVDGKMCLDRDLCCLGPKIKLKVPYFQASPDNFKLQEGIDVYFGGYPLSHTSLTFHKGIVSSIFHENGFQYFTIDGTMVAGLSGGPVVVQQNGEVLLLGILSSQVADLGEDFIKFETMTRSLEGKGKIFYSVKYTDGSSFKLTELSLFKEMLAITKNNLSTGVGRAIHVRHLNEVSSGKVTTIPLQGEETFTKIGDTLITGRKRGGVNARVIKNRLAELGCVYDGSGKGSHAKVTMTHPDGHQVSIPFPRGDTISDGVASSVISLAQGDERAWEKYDNANK